MLRYANSLPIAVVLLLTGCSTQVVVEDPTIPDPLIDRLPLSVGARYPEVFGKFVHEEQVIGKDKWLIDLGRSNQLLFDKLFGSMFTDYRVITADEDPDNFAFDAFIEPSIDAFEFSVPEQSQTDAFAVWIRYRIKVFDSQGTQIANWPISAYGKALTTMFGGDEALRRAAVLAMRDAAALIIMQMDKSTGISSLANVESPAAAPTAPESVLQSSAEDTNDETG